MPISACPLLHDPPFVLGLVWLAAAIGSRLLRLLRAPLNAGGALEHGLLSIALGLGLLQYLPFALGMAGHLTPQALWIGLTILTALSAADMGRIAANLWPTVRSPRIALRNAHRLLASSPLHGITAIVLAAALAVALLKALCPPTDPDGLGYHLTAPKRWLQAGEIYYLPTLLHTNAPMGVEMLFTLALALWSDTAAKLIHYALGLLASLAIFALGRRLRSAEVGFAAATLFLLGAPRFQSLPLLSWAYVDMGITLQLVCAALAWMLWHRTRERGWLTCAALCAGFAASFKLTGLFASVIFAALTCVARWREVSPGRALRGGLVYACVALLPLLPWLWRTWHQTGNPIYPHLSSLFPTRDWSPEAGAALDAYFKHYNWGSGLGAGWSLAQRQAARLAAMAVVATATLLLVWRWQDREARLLTAAAGALLLTALATTGLYVRLLLPVLALVYVILCMGASKALQARRWVQGLVLLLALANATLYVRGANPGEALAVVTGRLSRDAYLARRLPLMPLWNYVNVQLPKEARLLFAGLGGSYYSDRYCYLTDAYLQRRIRLDTWENYRDDIRQEGIGYAIVPDALPPQPRLGPDYAPARNELPFARRLAEAHGERLFGAGGMSLYRLENL